MAIETFRTADASDARVIAQLVNAAYRPQSIAHGWTHETDLVAGNRTSVDQIVTILSKSDSAILVGSKGTKILACVHVEKHGSDSHIGMLAVDPMLQGVGIGKQMLAYAENYAISYFNAKRFSLVVVSSRTELISFYLRRGYRKTGRALDYPQDAGVDTPKSAGLKIETLEKCCARNEPASTSEVRNWNDD